MSWKQCEKKTLWGWPIWQNCCQETTVKEVNYVKRLSLEPFKKDSTKVLNFNSSVQRTLSTTLDKVLCSDELKIKILGSNRRVYVRQRVCERTANPLYLINYKATIMVWGLHQVKGKLNQTGYHSLLQHHMILSGIQLMGQEFVFMQDDDPKQASKPCQRYIKSKEEQHILQVMSWPSQSVDLNPIKLVWDELEEKARAKQPISVAHLWQLLQESWAELSSHYF